MARAASPMLIRELGSLFDGGSVAGLSDRQLLERFIARRDAAGEAAFAALVARHGPMVLAVCRQLLGDRHHAEDGFQAVFLVLARKARSIREPELLGNWLYGVALRTARKARGRLARLRKTEADGAFRHQATHIAPPAFAAMLEREQAEALHHEIDRLPGAFRRAVVLCYFEGLSPDEAAQRLRWPAGTVRSRLVRAREKLRRGLLRRGVALSGPALAAALAPHYASASVSPLLCDSTTKAATAFAARLAANSSVSVSAAAMAGEILRAMAFHKLRLIALSLLLLGAVAAGAAYRNLSMAMGEGRPSPPDAQPAPVAAKQDDPAVRPAPGRMTVVGRVLDPEGKLVPGASVMVYGAMKQGGGVNRPGALVPTPIGEQASDASGLFRIDAPRTSSATYYRVGAAAIAPGFGVGWVDLDLDADQPAADITLRPEQVIQGRLFDLQGRPAEGVRVAVEGMGRARQSPDSLPPGLEGPVFRSESDAMSLRAWPRPAITDAEGRFTLHGIGRDVRVVLITEDPRFARQRIRIDGDGRSGSKPLTMALEPAKVISGRVTYADTGKPVPHAAIEIMAYREAVGFRSRFETDAEGRYRGNPLSAERYMVDVFAPEGEPYLNATSGSFAWTKGTLERRLDLVLNRGKLIRGKVTEEGSAGPVAGALLGFVGRPAGVGMSGSWGGNTQTAPDGSYELAVLPRAGTLVVQGPSEDYVFQEADERMIRQGQPGGRRWYAHAFIDCDLKAGGDTYHVNVVLRRGVIVKARVVGPGGQLVHEAWMFGQALTLPQPVPWRFWSGLFHGDVRNGRCELHGLTGDAETTVFFLDPKHQLGATVPFSGKAAAGGPLDVRLEPCGMATARLVDSAGKPLAGYRDPYLISMVVTPGASRFSRKEDDKGRVLADQDRLSRIDPIHYAAGVVADSRGRVTFPALIPGATYQVYDSTQDNGLSPRLGKEFVARTGEAIELGDIVIAKPRE